MRISRQQKQQDRGSKWHFPKIKWDRRYLIIGLILVLLIILIPTTATKWVKKPEPLPESTYIRIDKPELKAEPYALELRLYNAGIGKTVQIDIEEYTADVVSAEMPMSFSDEALKAQAIAARTFAINHCRKLGGSGCSKGSKSDVCSESGSCQAFCDIDGRREKWGERFQEYESRLQKAVMETAGQIMTYEDKPINVFYHSTSGGMTEGSDSVFGVDLPYYQPVLSPDEESSSRLTSQVKLSAADFIKKVKRQYPDCGLSAASLEDSVEVLSRTEGGRVDEARLGKAVISGKEFRKLFSLDSANFSLSFNGGDIVIDSRGFGHGVGMSQTGANGMAENGSNYIAILEHYYIGIDIINMNDLYAGR